MSFRIDHVLVLVAGEPAQPAAPEPVVVDVVPDDAELPLPAETDDFVAHPLRTV